MTIESTRSGATHFLASPAVTAIGGGLFATVAGGFFDAVQFEAYDLGFDTALIGFGITGDRTVDTAALHEVWYGTYIQSIGTKPWDAFYSGIGPTKMGIDLTAIVTNASGTWTKAAIVLNSGDRIYFNGTPGGNEQFASSTGTDFIEYSSGIGGLLILSGNSPVLQIQSSQVTVNTVFTSTSSIRLESLTATPAGGTAGAGLLFGSAVNFGIFYGSGLPTLSAGKGSLYLRSDGSQNARLYINTDGSTTWTAFNTAT